MKKYNNKNRDYTGLLRTPPSMAWLISQKSHLLGRLEKKEKTFRELPDEIQQLKQAIAALDTVIPLHEVLVDPSAIKGKRIKNPAILPHGVVTRGIFECLRLANGQPVTSVEIALHVARAQNISLNSTQLQRSIGKRLNAMADKGTVVRHHDRVTRGFGIWTLSTKVFDDEPS